MIPLSKKRAQAETYLLSKHNVLSSFNSVEDLVINETVLSGNDQQGIVHNIIALRSAIAKALWTAGIYVGVSVLDEFVLQAAQTGAPDITGRVMEGLRKAGANRPGFVLYPLTEFGLETPFFETSPTLRTIAVFPETNFAVSAQANSFDQAFSNITEMAHKLGISAPIDRLDVEHHMRAGHMKWLTYNPIMLVRLASHTGDYYENQFIYTLKIRIAAAQVGMLHALSIDAGNKVDDFYSTAEVNNFETLDIRHYLIGEGTVAGDNPLEIRRVPMNVAALDLARLSDLAVTLSTEILEKQEIKDLSSQLSSVLSAVERGYLKYVNLSTGESVYPRIYRRLMNAIDWYRQSFGSRMKEVEALVALAVAFETLLTDHYAPGTASRIERRVGICLAGNAKVAEYQAAVLAVYSARSEIVHTGDGGHRVDIQRAQAAFALCFCDLASRLENLSRTMIHPIRELLGDSLSQEEKDAKI
jgi:hypothetical protein